jgi:hypothetical protein
MLRHYKGKGTGKGTGKGAGKGAGKETGKGTGKGGGEDGHGMPCPYTAGQSAVGVGAWRRVMSAPTSWSFSTICS